MCITIRITLGVSASDVIREAIHSWLKMYDAGVSPYDRAADLIGIVQSGDKTRSTQTGRQFKKLLRKRGKNV